MEDNSTESLRLGESHNKLRRQSKSEVCEQWLFRAIEGGSVQLNEKQPLRIVPGSQSQDVCKASTVPSSSNPQGGLCEGGVLSRGISTYTMQSEKNENGGSDNGFREHASLVGMSDTSQRDASTSVTKKTGWLHDSCLNVDYGSGSGGLESSCRMIRLGPGIELPIPPLYDELAKSNRWPLLEDLEISEGMRDNLTTVAMVELKKSTVDKQRGMPWACFSESSVGYNSCEIEPLPHFMGKQQMGEDSPKIWSQKTWDCHSQGLFKQGENKKRTRPNVIEHAAPTKKKRSNADSSKTATGPALANEAMGKDKPEDALIEAKKKSEQLNNEIKRRRREMKMISLTQQTALEKAAERNPDTENGLEDFEVKKQWDTIIKRDLPRAFRSWQASNKKQMTESRKLADLCKKEVRLRASRNRKGPVKASQAMKKLCKEMLAFWKKSDKEAAELRKQEERAAAEQRKREEEKTEQKRQAQRLNSLLRTTELYSQFMAIKMGTRVDRQKLKQSLPTREEDATFLMKAKSAAEDAVMLTEERIKMFNTKFKSANGRATRHGSEKNGHHRLLNSSPMSTYSEVKQPDGFQGELKEYQLRGLQWMVNLYDQGLNGILADEMGLGKTIQAIAFLAHLAVEKNIWGPFLVVAPATILSNWDNEFSRFFPAFKVLPYWGSQEDRKILRQSFNPHINAREPSFHVAITSYKLVTEDKARLKCVKWQYMILDEAQAIKSSNSERWKTLLSFNCRNRILLTGTPIQNNLTELWALLHFIMPALFDNMEQFNDWFSKGLEQVADGRQELNNEELKRLHTLLAPFMLRRVKADVAGEMVSKFERAVFCDLSKRQRVLYEAIKEKLNLAELFNSDEKKVVKLRNLVVQLRKVCNHPELFEEQSERTSMYFSRQPLPLNPPAFGMLHGVYVSGSQPEIVYCLPKLVFREGVIHGSSALTGSTEFFRSNWLNHRLCVFHPFNTFESIHGGGTFGFTRVIGISPHDVYSLWIGDPLQKWVYHQKNHTRDWFCGEYWERHYDSKDSEGNFHCLRSFRICLVDVNCDVKVCSSVPDAADCVGCGPLVKTGEERMYSMLHIIKRVCPGFVDPVLAPPPEMICSDRSFANLQEKWRSSCWLRMLLFGNTPYAMEPFFPGGLPGNLVEVHTHVYSKQPEPGLMWPLYRCFGSAPQMQQYALAKALVDSGKLLQLDELLRKLKKGNHRVLLFSQMTTMMNILVDYLNFRRYKFLRLDGQSRTSDRRDMVTAFQTNPNIFVFLLSTRAGGLGINLTAADTVIFYESDWNPTTDLQAMDRAHRIGQTRDVTVYRLVCHGTIEEKILQRAKEKSTVQQLVMTGQANKGDLFAPEEVASLLLDDEESVSMSTYWKNQGDTSDPMTQFCMDIDNEEMRTSDI